MPLEVPLIGSITISSNQHFQFCTFYKPAVGAVYHIIHTINEVKSIGPILDP